MRKQTVRTLVLGLPFITVGLAVAMPRRNDNQQQQQQQQSNRQQQQGNQQQQQHHHGGPQIATDGAKRVDLVIALDTSSSMDGLIDSARAKLWDVVDLLAQARPQPVLRVGLISYGNDGYSASDGWVRKEADLTTDLDSVYARLFALRTNGGTEYVARAVRGATKDMSWDAGEGTLKMIFVAGNEEANQDPAIPVDKAVADARAKGIFVNTIYCGNPSDGIAALWQRAATVGSGQFAAINQNAIVAIAAPQDAELQRLGQELNGTYIAYGAQGAGRAANQAAQDANAASASPMAAATRSKAKASGLYRNDDWDLVDAKKLAKKDVAAMKAEELPVEMRAMKPEERQAFVDKKAKEREELQKRITALSQEREKFLAAERAKQGAKGKSGGLDEALGSAVKSEAMKSGFAF